ncbi:MAG: tetratricopeptide repeat protein [Candidatus Sumerlaeia bacterium]|nr:tetratricopeptide repeat protein [Candidatus Sumerlaeia bacterium]
MISSFFGNQSARQIVHTGEGRGIRAGITPLITGILLLMVLSTSSCTSIFGPKHAVPEEATARDQMRIAERQLEATRTTFDPDMREEELEKAVAAFRAVVERFPNDSNFTPLAHYYWALLTQQQGRYRSAERLYREVLRRYPNDDVVNASSLFGLAETYEQLGRGRDSQETYRELVEVYANSDDPVIQDLVQIARVRRGRVL